MRPVPQKCNKTIQQTLKTLVFLFIPQYMQMSKYEYLLHVSCVYLRIRNHRKLLFFEQIRYNCTINTLSDPPKPAQGISATIYVPIQRD